MPAIERELEPVEGERHLPLAGTYNVRDVGGYPTIHGRRTRWRTLLRADSPHRLLPEGRLELVRRGVRTVIDLRYEDELAEAPNAFVGEGGVRYRHLPLLPDPTSGQPRESATTGTLSETYCLMLETRAERMAEVIEALAQPDGLPALVHCTAGKDRTGLVVALVLSSVGVPAEVIAEDYALSACYLVGSYLEEAQERARRRGVPWEQYLARLVCPAPVMLETLAWLQGRYGGAESYLLHAGVPRQALTALRERLVED